VANYPEKKTNIATTTDNDVLINKENNEPSTSRTNNSQNKQESKKENKPFLINEAFEKVLLYSGNHIFILYIVLSNF